MSGNLSSDEEELILAGSEDDEREDHVAENKEEVFRDEDDEPTRDAPQQPEKIGFDDDEDDDSINEFDRGKDADPDFDADKEEELPNDNLNQEMVDQIQQETQLNKQSRDYMEKIDGRKPKRGNINTTYLVDDCDNLLLEMRQAYESDMIHNKQGRPGFAKLSIIDKVLKKLKHPEFANIFLDANGLEIIDAFLSMLPDGSWPLSNVREKILQAIYKLPISVDHLKASKLGKTLSLLEASRKEFEANKKLIQQIKDKWSRLICNITTEYSNLEHCERNYMQLPIYTKSNELEDEHVTS